MCMNERVRRQNDLNGEKTIIMEEKKESVIRVKNLYKIYQVGTNKVYALNGVDFTMYKGEFCAIVGPSGSGKSTLLNMLVCNESVRKIKKKRISKMTGSWYDVHE